MKKKKSKSTYTYQEVTQTFEARDKSVTITVLHMFKKLRRDMKRSTMNFLK